ncbi:MAG TPA: tRNA (adenosine(37)-N6)-threonylcarbamoyltransferase complex dimerization subunit type 1 TsaB [Pirellulales bacterium]|jgi:tRNA threonylcarbamoyladenosine biosynthesis protein TsaB|nr:tRNA (adenosine(37)-N6)-threonylcarbamoyltransferase complex dimerization subunit type 1 TsaB [Pirellulales bacterium]
MPVRILALETTGHAGSVAALADAQLLAEHALPPEQRSAQSLAPAMRSLLAEVGWRPRDVELLAVAIGPGSFTGLRVGVTTAKTFAYAVGADVIGIVSLDCLARQAPPDAERLSAVIDAHRRQVFLRNYARPAGAVLVAVDEPSIVDEAAWLANLKPGVAVTGPTVGKFADRLPAGVIAVGERLRTPMAATVGLLAHERYQRGERDDLWTLGPLYLRRAAAEEKADGV